MLLNWHWEALQIHLPDVTIEQCRHYALHWICYRFTTGVTAYHKILFNYAELLNVLLVVVHAIPSQVKVKWIVIQLLLILWRFLNEPVNFLHWSLQQRVYQQVAQTCFLNTLLASNFFSFLVTRNSCSCLDASLVYNTALTWYGMTSLRYDIITLTVTLVQCVGDDIPSRVHHIL